MLFDLQVPHPIVLCDYVHICISNLRTGLLDQLCMFASLWGRLLVHPITGREKMMVGMLPSCWDGKFSKAILNFNRTKSSFATTTGKGDNSRWSLILADTCFPCWNGKDWHSLRRAICKTRPVMKKRIRQGLVPHILDNVLGQVFSANLFCWQKSGRKNQTKKNPPLKTAKIPTFLEDSQQRGDFGGRGL